MDGSLEKEDFYNNGCGYGLLELWRLSVPLLSPGNVEEFALSACFNLTPPSPPLLLGEGEEK
jgi:hypothetical protein